ncbi:MAG: hypothetical protein KBE53_02985 [Chromatiaceae bacterium]|nr:hypothetical protein [Chromatiaceae bacterium]
MKVVGVGAVLRHQQPARQARLDLMKMGTSGGLGGLGYADIEIAVDDAPQVRAGEQCLLKAVAGDAPGGTRALDQGPHGGGPDPECQGGAEHALVADQPHFQGPIRVHDGDQGDDAPQREIGMRVGLIGLAQHIARDQFHPLALGQGPGARLGRQALQQAVGG